MNVKNRTLFIADNLDIMRGIDSETIDLIYLDPPFNTKKEYKAPIGSKAEGAEFKDIWTDEDIKNEWHGQIAEEHQELYQTIQAAEILYDRSMKIYLTAMAVRLFEMKRILKPTGSIYLHCDPTASHYLKLVMDKLFGHQHFRAEVIWKRHNAHNDKLYGTIHDTIFYYSYGDKSIPNDVLMPLSKNRLKSYHHSDERGKYSVGDLTASETRKRESGQPWRDFDPTARGRHWAVPRTGKYAKYIEQNFIPNYRSVKGIHERLNILDDAGFIYWNAKGTPQLKRYLMPDAGSPPQSLWDDIPAVKGDEKTGYPTQKPLALLERIIKASSNKGDVVLDPFCGCATACVAAEKLGRQWIGIDVSSSAEDITKIRLQDEVDDARFEPYSPNWSRSLTSIIISSDPPVRTAITETPRQILIEGLFRVLDREYSETELQEFRSNKHLLFGNQEGKCNGCQIPFHYRNMTIDHIVATSKTGGIPDDRTENLQLLCNACNSVKGDRDQDYLIKRLREQDILR